MPNSDTVEAEQSLASPSTSSSFVSIPYAPPVRLQKLDLARHIAIDPAGKRYVVASFDDSRLERGYITAVYPQQSGYLTLIRLVIVEFRSDTAEQALQRHVSVVEAIQRGELEALLLPNA